MLSMLFYEQTSSEQLNNLFFSNCHHYVAVPSAPRVDPRNSLLQSIQSGLSLKNVDSNSVSEFQPKSNNTSTVSKWLNDLTSG